MSSIGRSHARATALAGACLAVLSCRCESNATLGRPAPLPPEVPTAVAASPPPPPAPPAPTAAPTGGHPRLWLTTGDLPRLRSWANAKNPIWQAGIVPATKQAVDIYEHEFFPNGQPNPSWPDSGSNSWGLRVTEAYAEFFAFLSLVDPDPMARAAHGTRARNLLMHVMHEADKGVDASATPAPFRGRSFATFDRASWWGEAFALTTDWIYPLLSADDKATIRRVLMRWDDEELHAATSNEEHPQPIGMVNDPKLLADKSRLRWAINNYFTVHMRQLTLSSLCMDAVDDPPIDPSAPATQLGNTLRSYLGDAIGAWLYQQYAVYEDPAVSAPALGVPPDGLGAASGGLSAEGFLYGISLGALHEALLAMYTAGVRDPATYGPQIRFVDSTFWDRFEDGFLQSILPEPQKMPGQEYLGPVYSMAAYGDVQRLWILPAYAVPFLSIATHAAASGNTARLDKARWVAVNAVEGTAAGLTHRVAAGWGNSAATLAILYFLALDPSKPPAPDPRPSMPTVFYDPAIGRLLARTAWGPNASVFDYKCSWETIGHSFGDCNEFELWRKGEWLVREQTGYANDPGAITSEYHDTLAIHERTPAGTDKPRSLQWFEEGTWARGGQFTLGTNAGDPSVKVSTGSGWVYAQGDATPLYKRPSTVAADDATDVQHASRSIAWLEPDVVVVYDRATTRSDGLFKRFWLTSGGDADVTGKRATFTTPKGQKLTLDALLPATAVLSAGKATPFNGTAEGEPTRSKLRIEDPANPRDVRFLNVLQADDAGVAAAPVATIRSTAGTPFEGAAVGSFAAVFPVDLAASFSNVTYVVPKTVTAQLVSGLKPGTAYDVTLTPAGDALQVVVRPGTGHVADAAGVVAIGSLGAKAP